MNSPRLIFVNRFYWPDEPATAQLLTDLAEGLTARGHAVTVITSHPGRADVPRTEVRHGVRIIRVRRFFAASSHSNLVAKTAAFAAFFLGGAWQLFRTVRHGDTLVALTDPPLIGVLAWLSARLHRAHLIHWVQDIYPELAIVLARQNYLRLLRPLRDVAWRAADACVTLGPDMGATLTHARVPAAKISLIPNWAPAGLAPPPAESVAALRAEWGLSDKFIIAYSGNLGRVHDLAPILAVAEALRAKPAYAFVFIGDGPQRASLEAQVNSRGLKNIAFHPPQPRARLAATLALGHVHLVTLREGCESLVFPSKLYGIAAVGRPMIFIGPPTCELARLLASRGFGCSFSRDDSAGVANTLRTLRATPADYATLSAAALRFAASQGDAVTRWDALIRQLRQAC